MKTLYSQDFPEKLAEISDPPKKLYLAGRIPHRRRYLAVVGSRKYTKYGKGICQKLMQELAGSDICIVSGLALGIDAIAHKAALEAGLDCLAIPGSGLDKRVLYPKTNRPLAEKILKAGGGLLSEFEPDFKARAWSFPQRNRIMAGLSDAVLVIEATEKSGTLITARLASEYSRDVFTVPGSLKSASTTGPHMLIRQGAALIRNGSDIRKELGLEPLGENTDKSTDHLTNAEREIMEILSEPRSKDDVITMADLPANKINIILSQMELKGLIVESNGRIEKK
ncbi:MAG: DNA-processing protein DprA [Candidatus Paceibacterota bacterium]